jgi:hypothetical protein
MGLKLAQLLGQLGGFLTFVKAQSSAAPLSSTGRPGVRWFIRNDFGSIDLRRPARIGAAVAAQAGSTACSAAGGLNGRSPADSELTAGR